MVSMVIKLCHNKQRTKSIIRDKGAQPSGVSILKRRCKSKCKSSWWVFFKGIPLLQVERSLWIPSCASHQSTGMLSNRTSRLSWLVGLPPIFSVWFWSEPCLLILVCGQHHHFRWGASGPVVGGWQWQLQSQPWPLFYSYFSSLHLVLVDKTTIAGEEVNELLEKWWQHVLGLARIVSVRTNVQGSSPSKSSLTLYQEALHSTIGCWQGGFWCMCFSKAKRYSGEHILMQIVVAMFVFPWGCNLIGKDFLVAIT